MGTLQEIEQGCIAVVGPTAIGKTRLSLLIAEKFDCEVISVDSMQVYRYMDIGTAKIRADEMRGIPHHLLDIADPDESYDAARFVRDATAAAGAIISRGRIPLFTGGTGLYLKALVEGLFEDVPRNEQIRQQLVARLHQEGVSKLHEELSSCDPVIAEKIHRNDTQRVLRGLEVYLASGVPWSTHLKHQREQGRGGNFRHIYIAGLTCERDQLYRRINLRTDMMLAQGLEAEVAGLLERGYSKELHSMRSIGYRHMNNYLDGEWGFDEMKTLLARDTRRYAKRQYTWFNRIPNLEWFEVSEEKKILQHMSEWLKSIS